MASESIIILYDTASASGKPMAWSASVSKARFALDLKGIPYETIWLEYPDIEPTMRRIGAASTAVNTDGSPRYTVPAIVDPSRRTSAGEATVVSDSWTIVEYLDAAYPGTTPLLPEGTKALQALFQGHFERTVYHRIGPIMIPLVPDLLNEPSRIYWRTTREAAMGGVKLEEMCPKGSPQWDEAWTNLKNGFTEIAALLDKNGSDGKFVMGSKVTLADFMVASVLESIYLIVPDEWEAKIKYRDGGRWERFRNDCAQWRSVH